MPSSIIEEFRRASLRTDQLAGGYGILFILRVCCAKLLVCGSRLACLVKTLS
jgi:hypothetical protein